MIYWTKATERLTRRLERAGIKQAIVAATNDSAGKYLRIHVGGKCIGGAGWTLAQAKEVVDHLIKHRDDNDPPPLPY